MFEEFATSSGSAETSGIELHTIWNVNADPSYDINHEFAQSTSQKLHAKGGKGLIALYTINGNGRIYLGDYGVIDVIPETLIIIRWDHLERYNCKSAKWNFWWFEFIVSGPMHFPAHRLIDVPLQPDDRDDFQLAFAYLRRQTFEQRALASATFSKMLYRWIAHWQGKQQQGPYQEEIDRIIDRMYEKLSLGWPISEMAEEANMSERNFRKTFRTITGQSPKTFYDNLRLAMAKERLRLGIYTVAEIASQLGFSSPFHLSKAFKKHFGNSPSKFRSKTARP
ncbi:MAG: helix-turn-helix transcriptional regulator [Anaerohalosphaera sp.]|nr:helix-turn-helix transcriptional regulator [Anaerohalosphaera sp.]